MTDFNLEDYEFPELVPGDQDWRWCHKYCYDVVTGKLVAGKHIKLAAQRHFDDLQNDNFVFSEKAATSIVSWFKFVPITDGHLAGTATQLSPSQIFIVCSLMGWLWANDEYEDVEGIEVLIQSKGTRRFNQAFILVARKYGKTTLAAGLKLYIMYKGGHRPRAFSLATKRDQAKEVWDTAKEMIRLSPRLSQIFKVRANDILMPAKAGYYVPLASDSKSLDGLNPIVASLDECFVKGTMIGEIPIEEIKTGDMVDTYCETTGLIYKGIVGKTYKNEKEGLIYTIKTNNDDVIECTGNHPIYVSGYWMYAENVQLGSMVFIKGLGEVSVSEVSSREFSGHVYNFEVLNTHTYFANGVLVHNCHAIKDRNLYGVIVSAFGAQIEYLMLVITTAGFILDGLCTDLLNNGERTLDPEDPIKQDNYFYAMFTLDKKDDWSDSKAWFKSNPDLVYGRPRIKYLKDRFQEAVLSTEEKANFLTKHCNFFVSGSDKWLDISEVKANHSPGLSIDDPFYKGRKCYVSLDRARIHDLCSFAILFPTDNGGLDIFWINLLPQKTIDNVGDYLKAIYRKALDSGDLRAVTSTTVLDSDVKKVFAELKEKFKPVSNSYDPWHMREICEDLEEIGYPMIAVSQGTGNMSEPAKKLEGLLKEGLVRYDSSLFEYACGCAMMNMTRKNNMEIYRENDKVDKIDPLIAAIIGLSAATLFKVDKNIYEERGLLSL